MGGKILAYLCLGAFFGFLVGSSIYQRAERQRLASGHVLPAQLTEPCENRAEWVCGASAPSGAVTSVPTNAVRLNRAEFSEGEARREWYRIVKIEGEPASWKLAILPRKQNSPAVAYLISDDGRAIPVEHVELIRK